MDPTVLLGVVGVMEKLHQVFGDAAYAHLERKTVRWRVAWRSLQDARRRGIGVTFLGLTGWLARPDTRRQLTDGPDSIQASVITNLAFRLSSSPDESRDEAAVRLLAIVLNEYLRVLSPQDALADAFQWSRTQAVKQHLTTREHVSHEATRVIESLSEESLDRTLSTFHPWRAAFAREIAHHWPGVRDLLQQLASARNRGQTLSQWSRNTVQLTREASPDALAWLALMSSDHDDNAAALIFVKLALEKGISDPDYWWALAGLFVDQQAEPQVAEAILNRSTSGHPLAQGQLALLKGEYELATRIALDWNPAEEPDLAIRALILSAAHVGADRFDLAIEQLTDAIELLPDATGLKIRLADMLLSRGYLGSSDHAIEDYLTARQLALDARDSRRKYRQDSVAAILTAIKATILCNDTDDAWKLTQPEPFGRCNAEEASDPRVRREATILSALRGDVSSAQQMAASLNDHAVTAWVTGWVEHLGDRDENAVSLWLDAWDSATDDSERLMIAHAIASVGGALPDLSLLRDIFPDQVDRLHTLQRVMAAPGDQLELLRVRAGESEELTSLLAERLRSAGMGEAAAEVLSAAARRWRSPLLMRMAASTYLEAGSAMDAVSAARDAISLGGPRWPGRLASLALLFSAQEAGGLIDDARLTAHEMIASAPDSADARWAFVQCLLRAGELANAWTALNYRGNPIRPRSAAEARQWVYLVTRFDKSPYLVTRTLEVVREWPTDVDLTGIFLMMIYEGLRGLEIEAPQHQIAALRTATTEYIEKNPHSRTFRVIQVAEDDDFIPRMVEELQQNERPPEIKELLRKVQLGELPIGVMSSVLNRSYLECVIVGTGPHRYSHSLEMQARSWSVLNQAKGRKAVIDTTALATLALLDSKTSEKLVGEFSFLKSTDGAYRDALQGQQIAGMRSTLSVGLDASRSKLIAREIPQEEADRFAERAERVVELLGRADRRGWPRLQHFKDLNHDMPWLSALDLALTQQIPFWCDDIALRRLGESEGLPTFGTIDLLRHMEAQGAIPAEERRVVEARLISDRVVDLGFDIQTVRLAAELDGWNGAGAASSLVRPFSWENPEATLNFGLEAIQRNASARPENVAAWTWALSSGLLAIAPDAEGGTRNLRIFLLQVMTQEWATGLLLPFVLAGLREAMEGRGLGQDPLEWTLRNLHGRMSDRHGPAWAASSLLLLVEHLRAEDRSLAARIILTQDLLSDSE